MTPTATGPAVKAALVAIIAVAVTYTLSMAGCTTAGVAGNVVATWILALPSGPTVAGLTNLLNPVIGS